MLKVYLYTICSIPVLLPNCERQQRAWLLTNFEAQEVAASLNIGNNIMVLNQNAIYYAHL